MPLPRQALVRTIAFLGAVAWTVLGLLKLLPIVHQQSAAPGPWITLIAVVEVGIGILIFLPVTRGIGLKVALSVALVLVLGNTVPNRVASALDEGCGCLGPDVHVQRSQRRAIAGSLALLSMIGLARSKARESATTCPARAGGSG